MTPAHTGIDRPESNRAPAAARYMAVGAGVGLVWGVAMRFWMRFITTAPEFTWSGTLFIVLGSAGVGALLGFARHRQRVGGMGWWRLSLLSLLLLGAAGVVMWPTVIVGGIAIGRVRHRWWRTSLLVLAVALQIPVIQREILGNPLLNGFDAVLAILWYFPMLAVETWGFSVCFAPRSEQAPQPGPLKRAVLGVTTGLMCAAGAFALGVQLS